MGSPHRDRSQEALHEAFPGFANLVAGQIRLALTLLSEDIVRRPIRILDIGAGSVPYESAFDLSDRTRMDLTLLDRHDVVNEVGSRIKKAGLHSAQIQKDFFELYDADSGDYKPELAKTEILGKFEFIVLSASVHELCFDAVAVHGRPENFHEKLLSFLRTSLLSDDGILLIADYAWPISAPAEHTWRIQKLQDLKRGHADPPWAFIGPTQLQLTASRVGFAQKRSVGRGLYDELDDNALNGIEGEFGGELTTAELATARLRVGYVITMAKDCPSASRQQTMLLRRKSFVHVSRKAEEALRSFTENRDLLLNRLNSAFVDPVPALGKRPPLWHLTSAIREEARTCLQYHQLESPKTYEIWFGVGLERLNKRFVPKLPCPWLGSLSIREAGALSADELVKHERDAEPLVAGPVSDFFEILRDDKTPNIHKWADRLHRMLRDRDSTVGVEKSEGWPAEGSGDFNELRSVTVMLARRSSDAASSLALSALWGDQGDQERSGHYLRILRGDKSLADQVDDFLRHVARSVVGRGIGLREAIGGKPDMGNDQLREEEVERGIENYGTFLNCALGEGDGQLFEKSSKFVDWWRKLTGNTRPISYNFFSTIVSGCDGLSPSPPNTIMIFGEQSFPPQLLERIDDFAFDLFGRLGDVEAAVIREGEVQARERYTQQRQALVSFGHDGKRPALTILRVANGGWNLEDKTAVIRFLASSLWYRLGSYSSLVGAADDPDQARERLEQEAKNAIACAPISAIWRRELICVLLRCAVDESGWEEIRRALWSERGRLSDREVWENLRPSFGPVLDLRCKSALIEDELVDALDTTARALRRHKVSIDFSGDDLEVPQVCSGSEGQMTEPRLAMALAFLFGEFATNTFRHQFPELASMIESDGLTARLKVEEDNDESHYKLVCEFRPVNPDLPAPKTDFRRYHDKTFIGLTSIQSTVAAIGCSAHEETFRWRSKGKELSDTFPYFTMVKNADGRTVATKWTIGGLIRKGIKNA
jgi:hypothetical protein